MRFVAALASPGGRGGNMVTAILDLIAGIVILSWPDLGLSTLAVIIGIVLILRGLFFIVPGWQLHKLNDDLAGSPTAHALTWDGVGTRRRRRARSTSSTALAPRAADRGVIAATPFD